MNQPELENIVRTALKFLVENDSYLLKSSVNERSVTSKLSGYMQQLLPSFNVDGEYNRHGSDIKRLIIDYEKPRAKLVIPDIVVHNRGNDDNNILVIEVKLLPLISKIDDIKLKEFTKHDGIYRYNHGLFIGFNKLNSPLLVWYQDGKQLEIALDR